MIKHLHTSGEIDFGKLTRFLVRSRAFAAAARMRSPLHGREGRFHIDLWKQASA